MALRILRTIGDVALRKPCREVTQFDEKLKVLVKDMAETMYHEQGVGLAAPQIGILKRIVVIDMGNGLELLINPRYVKQEGEQEVTEACLSIPERTAVRTRPFYVEVEAQDLFGQWQTFKGSGDYAKCLCHEIDHLDGILYIDDILYYL